jgi:hypothetical protein
MKEIKKTHLQQIPWWIHIIIATILYIGLTYLIPTLHTETPWINSLLSAAPHLAPIGTIAFLLLGAKALCAGPGKKCNPPVSKEGNE